ncbi:MAG: NAD-dependent epimerase/dehydratase family protein [bacterium]|nr:NAD-dependent epimerase/dehydratase family protein [bacterium]
MTNTTQELHVVFGTGPMGAAIMHELVQRGKRVRMINRRGKPSLATGAPHGVEFQAGDLYQPGNATVVSKGATHIYQAAQPEYHEWTEKFPPIQNAVLEAAIAHQARLIVVENLYMYGDVNGQPITETLPYRPSAPVKGTLRQRLTEQLIDAHLKGRVRVVMGRGADFYGPGDMVQGEQTFIPALKGKTANGVGNIDLPHSFTYTKDFGKALVILGEHDQAFGQAWHVPTNPPLTQRELITMIYQAAGTEPKMRGASTLMMRALGLFVPAVKEMVEMMYEFNKPFILDSSKFTTQFGMTATPHQDAVRETVAWFRANLPAIEAQAH